MKLSLLAIALVALSPVWGETIGEIQGGNHFSTFEGKSVTGVTGRVTRVVADGFYFQSAVPDNNDDTSDGLYVYVPSANTVWAPFVKTLQVGQEVSVNAQVLEYAFVPAGGAPKPDLPLT
ncbi:hypothetical protein HK097_004183, partial [Rhizophlyctis rosea]